MKTQALAASGHASWILRVPHFSVGILGCLLLVSASPVLGQVNQPKTRNATQGPGASAAGGNEETVTLTPFEVRTESDKSYGAQNSNSIASMSTELNKMPVSGDIFTETFMDDVGETSLESLVRGYSAGAGFSTLSPNTSAGVQPGDYVSSGATQLRGFSTPAATRDGILTLGTYFNPGGTGPGYTHLFDIERVDVVKGPQSLLFSTGGSGGVINQISKQARLGQKAFGSVKFQIDGYGSRTGQLDFGASQGSVAVRGVILDDDHETRRDNIGQHIKGQYLQFAVKLFENTVVRLSGEHTLLTGNYNITSSLTTGANDLRNGSQISYLLATSQMGADTLNASGQPNSAGAIVNGKVTWDNLNSFTGWLNSQRIENTFGIISVESKLNSWLSAQISGGYDEFSDGHYTSGSAFLATQAASNPLGVWAISGTPGDLEVPSRNKSFRASLVATGSFFGGRAHSETMAGADYYNGTSDLITYSFYRADDNFNVIVNPAIAANAGRTLITPMAYSIDAGPATNPLFLASSDRVTINGVNYVRQVQTVTDPSKVTASNPLGVVGAASGTYLLSSQVRRGAYLINNTEWFNDKLTTLVGVRASETSFKQSTPTAPNIGPEETTMSYEFGANYKLSNLVRPYVNVSSSAVPPQFVGTDPNGKSTASRESIGEELGVKISTQDGRLSGSVAAYHVSGTNEPYSVNGTILSDIVPNGLNGAPPNGTFISVERETKGLEVSFTASPTRNWRIRLNAATNTGNVKTTNSYVPQYNDQFYANSNGQVTYANGTLVYVNSSSFSATTPTLQPGDANAVPLTIAMMNSSSNIYFANPINPSGAINKSSAVATVLQSSSAANGPILTGKVGLPNSSIQITPSFALPQSILVTQAGDMSLGSPKYSFSLTQSYEFSDGVLKGFRIGGTFSTNTTIPAYYYYPQGLANPNLRQLFYTPSITRFDGMLGYSKRFKRVTWSAQLNVNNVFDKYSTVVLPSATTGYLVGANLSAAYFGQPRAWILTNTLSF